MIRKLIALVPEPPASSSCLNREWWNMALHDERYGLIPLVREAQTEMGNSFEMAQATCYSSVRAYYRAKVNKGEH